MSDFGPGIKVAIRCRPFACEDKLGVLLQQFGEETGEVRLINCDYTTTRFRFNYAWWSAFNYKQKLKDDDMPKADGLQLVDQESVYNQCGHQILENWINGVPTVMFAYGLSGSGKSYTVFGPDAADAPEAWFKHGSYHPLWGLFPRIAYKLFQEKPNTWTVSLKYVQNVVDTVRDLLSPAAEERHYKTMRKYDDGSSDFEWCKSVVVTSWDELRETINAGNARRSMASTQYSQASPKGHSILILEIEMPDQLQQEYGVTDATRRCRLYIADLAGTEPAGDLVCAEYDRLEFDDGSFEYRYRGPHPDAKKTKALQEDAKKINLSLSELAQLFMKLAELSLSKKPATSFEGCKSFCLCAFFRDILLKARTYLFCAIRPEVQFLKYTFATLGFAKNALKLLPAAHAQAPASKAKKKSAPPAAEKVTSEVVKEASATERKLVAEIEAMEALSSQLTASAGDSSESKLMIAELQAKLADKRADLEKERGRDEKAAVRPAKVADDEGAKDAVKPKSKANKGESAEKAPIVKLDDKNDAYLKEALTAGRQEWARSKIMIVGEGRAGKTALANSVLGRAYANLDSTVGINEFTCSIGYANVAQDPIGWQECAPEHKKSKALESTLAKMIADQRAGKKANTAIQEEEDGSFFRPIGGGFIERSDLSATNLAALAEQPAGAPHPEKKAGVQTPVVETTKAIKPAPSKPTAAKPSNTPATKQGATLATANKQPVKAAVDNHKPVAPQHEELHEVDHELVMKYLGDQSNLRSKFLISVFDFGGQSVFNVIHPFFLTRFGVYFLVFNMEWLCKSAEAAVRENCIQYMTFWLNSIIIHTQNEKGEVAPVFLVGTRKDTVKTPAEHQSISTTLYNLFATNDAWPYIVENRGAEGPNGKCDFCFFPVDNTLGNKDPTVVKLLKAAEDTIDKMPYVHMERPLSWFRVMDALKACNVPYMKYERACEIIVDCGVPLERVPYLLRFFHEMGILMWHDEDTLRDVVVFDPIECFVKPATIVICKHVPDQVDGIYHSLEVHSVAKKVHAKAFAEMIQYGIVSEVLLVALLSEYQENYSYIKQLMLKYGLLMPLMFDSNEDKPSLYLAPALLPDSKDGLSPSSFYFVFATSDDYREKPIMSFSDCTTGFLPSGLFERLIAKALTWSMHTSDYFNRDTLHRCRKNATDLAFGNQTFQIAVDYARNLIAVALLQGSNPLGVHDRLREQIQEIIAECLKSLRFVSVLPYQLPDSDPLLLQLSHIRGAAEKKSIFTIPIRGSRTLLNPSDMMKQFGPWLADFSTFTEYDLFISYRWGQHDSLFTKELFDCMSWHSVENSMRPIRTFLDTRRLETGENFQAAFVKALSSSLIMVPIVSAGALRKMQRMHAEDEDNVLIEWICGLAFLKAPTSRLSKIMPVFVGARTEEAERCGNFFAEGHLDKLPDEIPSGSMKAATQLLKDCNVTISAELQQSTVKQIVTMITKFLSILAWKVPAHRVASNAASQIVPILNDCLTKPKVSPDAPAAEHHGDASSSQQQQSSAPRMKGTDLSLSALRELVKKELGVESNKIEDIECAALDSLTEDQRHQYEKHTTTKDKLLILVELLGLL